MSGPLARILLRYLAGALVARGLIDPDAAYYINTDPSVIELATIIVGTALGFLSERFYTLAKKYGWAT